MGFGVGGPRVDSRAPAALTPPRGGAGCAAGGSTLPSRGWKGRGLDRSPSPSPRCAPREAARLAGGARLGWPVPAPAPHPGIGGFRGARREAAGMPGRLAPVPTIRVSHGWSEVLFLKRLQGGHKQPPTSLPCALWTVNPVWGPGPGRCTWRVERGGGSRARGGGQRSAPRPSWLPGAAPPLRGWRPRGGRLGSVVAQLQGTWLIRALGGGESCGAGYQGAAPGSPSLRASRLSGA